MSVYAITAIRFLDNTITHALLGQVIIRDRAIELLNPVQVELVEVVDKIISDEVRLCFREEDLYVLGNRLRTVVNSNGLESFQIDGEAVGGQTLQDLPIF